MFDFIYCKLTTITLLCCHWKLYKSTNIEVHTEFNYILHRAAVIHHERVKFPNLFITIIVHASSQNRRKNPENRESISIHRGPIPCSINRKRRQTNRRFHSEQISWSPATPVGIHYGNIGRAIGYIAGCRNRGGTRELYQRLRKGWLVLSE